MTTSHPSTSLAARLLLPAQTFAYTLLMTATAAAQTGSVQATRSPEATFLDYLLEFEVLGMDLWRVAAAAVVIMVGFALQGVLIDKLTKPIALIFERTETNLDNLLLEKLQSPLRWLVRLLAVYLGLVLFDLPLGAQQGVDLLFTTLGTLLVAWGAFRMVDVLVHAFDRFAEGTESEIDNQLVPVTRRILRFILVIIAGLLVVQQWGYDATSLIAGLGIGGLAFALAAKQMLSNWFGAVMIFTDRPFQVGDWVSSSHGEGIIEEVGLRSTRIRTFDKTLITVPNSDLTGVPVENKSQMPARRISATLRLDYDTSHDQMMEILDNIEAALEGNDRIQEGGRANFDGFTEDALEISIWCFADTTDGMEWRRIRQQLWLEVMKIVEEAGTDFAYPTQTVKLEDPEVTDAPRSG